MAEDTQPKIATRKANKKPQVTAEKVREAYMAYMLEYGYEPPSIFVFAKSLGLKESEFYNFYNSFTAIKKAIWLGFFSDTLERLHSEEVYMEYSVREKLLAFYYTWIEVLKENRSYVIQTVKEVKKPELTPAFLKPFKEHFVHFANELLSEGKETEEVVDRPVIGNRYDDGLWLQLLFILNFWVKDDSQGFEKTDAAIEKAVNLSFDLMGKTAIDSLVNFAKFMFQNR
jgi:hypothetical protein